MKTVFETIELLKLHSKNITLNKEEQKQLYLYIEEKRNKIKLLLENISYLCEDFEELEKHIPHID